MTLFYELIQVALGSRSVLSQTPTEAEWHDLYGMCQKQSVTGVAFAALESLSGQRQKPPVVLLYQWIGDAEQIKRQNQIVNQRCVEISRMFDAAGFKTCILKGQGNARMYPNPLARTSGDIDLWVDAKRDEIDDFVHTKFPEVKGGRMHIEFPVFDDVAVEVHYIPRYMFAPWHDRRMQAFFQEKKEEQFSNLVILEGAEGTCAVPTVEFNLIQQLSHMMSHVMGEGIGLRQFIDYFYVLKAHVAEVATLKINRKSDEKSIKNTDFELLIKQCGLLKFAQGVMWIEKNLLGLEDKYLIVEPSERIGSAIQQTIEEGGNFGHHSSVNAYRHQSLIGRVVGGTRQSLRAMRYFPTEATWKIIKKII